MYRGDLAVVVNLSATRAAVPVDGTPVEVPLSSEHGFGFAASSVQLEPESVAVVRLLPRRP
jgi:hypothetical protein